MDIDTLHRILENGDTLFTHCNLCGRECELFICPNCLLILSKIIHQKQNKIEL